MGSGRTETLEYNATSALILWSFCHGGGAGEAEGENEVVKQCHFYFSLLLFGFLGWGERSLPRSLLGLQGELKKAPTSTMLALAGVLQPLALPHDCSFLR